MKKDKESAGPLVRLESVSVCFGEDTQAVWALRDVSFEISAGEFVSITGPSGSGKTTLLNVVGGLEAPTNGAAFFEGRDLNKLSDREISRLRRRRLGYVFQFSNLMPTLTAMQNIELPLRADLVNRSEACERAADALAAVGLYDKADRYSSELSGGEMQRVAIARGLATEASLILADEPTGNLDSARSEQVLKLLKSAVEEKGRTVVLVTHNYRAAAYGDRTVLLRDGRVKDILVAADEAEIHDLARYRK